MVSLGMERDGFEGNNVFGFLFLGMKKNEKERVGVER